MTNLEKDGIILCVYGTLRMGCGNHRYLEGDKVEYLGTTSTSPSYTMYSLGGFPGVAENGETSIVIEAYRVKNPEVLKRVYQLEGYSGERGSRGNWYDTCDVETPWGVGNMFIMNNLREISEELPEIKSGDWLNKKK